MKYVDVVEGKGKFVEVGVLMMLYFECKYRGLMVLFMCEVCMLGGNCMISELF